jgi:hypothetical protein
MKPLETPRLLLELFSFDPFPLAKAHPQPLIGEIIILITLRDPGREVSEGPEEAGAFRDGASQPECSSGGGQ